MAEAVQRTTLRDVGAASLVVLALFVPEITIEFTPLRPDASMLIAGILPVLTASLYARRYALAAIPLCGLGESAAGFHVIADAESRTLRRRSPSRRA